MLQISSAQIEALTAAQSVHFRGRAFDHARQSSAVAPNTPDESLNPPFDYVEAIARDCAIEAEQSRLSLFLLALAIGPQLFQQPAVMEMLRDRDVPERIRIREVLDLAEAIG